MQLLPFQKRFIAAIRKPGIITSALCLPRGNGKSSLIAWLAYNWLQSAPVNGVSHIISGSADQGKRTVFRQLTAFCGDDADYKIANSVNIASVTYLPTDARVSVLACNPKTAQGLVGVDWLFCDEPGAWEINAGQAMADAIDTAQGKPDSTLQVVYLGTLAPGGLPGHWWHDLVTGGTQPGIHVTALQGNPEAWDKASEIRRCNPLMWKFPQSRKQLLSERDKARRDSRLEARFKSYRLNYPARDSAEVLLTVSDYELAIGRPVAIAAGMPIVGIDLGAGRAFSSAVAIWPSGRVEAVAVCAGIPSIADIEARDNVPANSYQCLVDAGLLFPSPDRRVPPVSDLLGLIADRWGRPSMIIADRFRVAELNDVAPRGWHIESRVTRWSDAAEDVRALRSLVLDGPLTFDVASRDLITASLAIATIKNDDAGNCRLVKREKNKGRDDVAAALLLAAGQFQRERSRPKPKLRVLDCA